MSNLRETSQEHDILLAALDLPDEQRESFVNGACMGRSDLRERISKLLQAATLDGSFMEKPVLDLPLKMASAIAQNEVETVGKMIGLFKLLQVIGQGGMGSVYMAEQKQPVERRVALKIIKAGMDSRQVIARFEAERQALAMMDHPNIAKVLDAGTTNSGRPYFVMELVKGIPITKYCDDKKLTVRQRLELMVPVCNAIQHAHHKGIIHRDIKPGNILVAQYDGKPVPKVIDFGIAKATAQKLTEKSMFTEFGQIIGTLEYMSPEQAEMNQLDIDTRSDVYSLGVLLYELLTGSTPLDGKQMRSLAFVEMLRMIREEEPPRPSNRLSTSDTLANVAANRQTEPAKLSGLLRGELDWIALMALDKDRNRRYETVNGLAQDIERYLRDEPVAACPPSSAYRFRKFARRNKTILATAFLVAVSLCVGLAGTGWQAIRAMQAETKALAESEQKEVALKSALNSAELERNAREAEAEQRKQARESEEDLRVFSEFLVNDILAVARPEGENGGLGIDVSVRTAMDAAAERIGSAFQDRPNAEALVRHAIGVTYRQIGELDEAEPHLRKAYELRKKIFGDSSREALDSRNSLTVLLSSRGRYREALCHYEAISNAQKSRPGAKDDPATYKFALNLALAYHRDEQNQLAISLGEECLANLQRLSVSKSDILYSMNCLGSMYVTTGKIEEGLSLLEKSSREHAELYGPDQLETLRLISNLAKGYEAANKFDQAIPLFNEALGAMKMKLGSDHPETIKTLGELGICYSRAEQPKEGLHLLEKSLRLSTEKLGREHPDSLESMNGLGVCLYQLKRYDEAELLYEELVSLSRKTFGDTHRLTRMAIENLATQYKMQGQEEKADTYRAKMSQFSMGKLSAVAMQSAHVFDMKGDSAGNHYFTGTLTNSRKSPKPPAYFGEITIPITGVENFVAKQDTNGQFVWAVTAGNPLSDKDTSRSTALDSEGNIFIAGSFEGESQFGSTSLTSQGAHDAFVAKLDGTSGQFLWARQMGGPGKDMGHAVAVDASGNVIVTGVVNMLATAVTDAAEVSITKFDTTGQTLWTKSITGEMKGSFTCVDTDATGAVYVGGRFAGTAGFPTGTLRSSFYDKATPNISDGVVCKIDSDGNWLWTKVLAGDSLTTVHDLIIGPDQQLYLATRFKSSLSCDGRTFASKSGIGILVGCHESTSGSLTWAQSIENVSACEMVFDSQGILNVAGVFQGTADFGSETLSADIGFSSAFLSKLTKMGVFFDSRIVAKGKSFIIAGPATPYIGITLKGLHLDEFDNAYLGGSYYGGNVDFPQALPISEGMSGIVVKLPPTSLLKE